MDKAIIKNVLQTLHGQNYWRVLAIISLVTIAVFSFLLIPYVHLVLGIIGIYCLIMIIFIKFPSIYMNEDHFVIVRKSVVEKLTEQITFNYCDLKDIKFSEGYTNWLIILLRAFTSSFTPRSEVIITGEQNSKSDTMIITYLNNEKIEINRIGNRKEFMEIIEAINKRIKPTLS